MWRFKPGYLGACIVAVAILGGLLLGSVANVSTHTENTTAYEYKTDITGLFDVSQEPQFLNFNPATNYTGYANTDSTQYQTDPTGIKYSTGSNVNNYRVLKEPGVTTAGPSGTINNSSSYPQPSAPADMYDYRGVRYILPEWWNFTDFKYTTFYDWAVSTFGALTNYSLIEVYFNDPRNNPNIGTGAYISKEPYSPGLYHYDFNCMNNYHFVIHPDSLTIDLYEVIQGQERVTYTFSLYEYYICYGNTYYQHSNTTGSTTWTINFTSTVTTPNTYNYMLPANGTEIKDTANGTIWDNDQGNTNYDNYSVNVLIGPRFDNGAFVLGNSGRGLAITLNKVGGGTDVINVVHGSGGSLGANLWLTNINGSVYGLGHFPAVMLAIEKSPYTDGNKINFYPVTAFSDYLNVSVAPDPILSLAGSDYDLDNITFNRYEHYSVPGADNIAWSVYNTVVFMETYNAVFHDPSINLAEYWPDMDSYRFSLNSVALYGDSVTINGVNYPVTDQTITINDRAYTLKNCYISFSKEGTASITFNDINRTVDLGPTVSKVLAFYGNWGFTMGLYEGVTSTKDVYDWDVKLLGDGLNTCILIALGVLAVVTLACFWLKVGLKLTDKLVLGAGALILVMFLVV